jgi:hypothetical protein
MTTLSHTQTHQHSPIRVRVALIVAIAAAVAVLAIVLIGAGGKSSTASSAAPSQAQLDRQLQSVQSARYKLELPQRDDTTGLTPKQQLQAVAGPRAGVQLPR